MCSSKHNCSGTERDADKGHRFHEILEIRQSGCRHLGCHIYNRDTPRRRVRIISWRAILHRKVTRSCCATLYMQTRSCTRYRALFRRQEI